MLCAEFFNFDPCTPRSPGATFLGGVTAPQGATWDGPPTNALAGLAAVLVHVGDGAYGADKFPKCDQLLVSLLPSPKAKAEGPNAGSLDGTAGGG